MAWRRIAGMNKNCSSTCVHDTVRIRCQRPTPLTSVVETGIFKMQSSLHYAYEVASGCQPDWTAKWVFRDRANTKAMPGKHPLVFFFFFSIREESEKCPKQNPVAKGHFQASSTKPSSAGSGHYIPKARPRMALPDSCDWTGQLSQRCREESWLKRKKD